MSDNPAHAGVTSHEFAVSPRLSHAAVPVLHRLCRTHGSSVSESSPGLGAACHLGCAAAERYASLNLVPK